MRLRAIFILLSLAVMRVGLSAQAPANAQSSAIGQNPAAAAARGPRTAADPAARYHRLVCLVHLTGSGKPSDPRVPEYVPAAIDPGRTGIIAWSMQLADDGQMAIVEYVAVDRKAFTAILADKRPEIRVFEIGKTPAASIEAAMGEFKKGFTLSSLQVAAQ